MTNSNQEKLKAATSQTAPTTPDADERADNDYVSDRGTVFKLVQLSSGLWIIRMNKGGSVPQMCTEMYTGRKEAEKELEKYLRTTDRLGDAKFPNKGT